MTQDPATVVTRVAVDAPDLAFALLIAPIAPEPLVPEVFTPEKDITVRDDDTFWERLAATLIPLRVVGEKARQISDVPLCTFVRDTSVQVNPPPVTLVTVVFVPPR
jgi:carbamate kinase